MTIGDGNTRSAHPNPITRGSTYAKGITTNLTVDCNVTGLAYIYDDFASVDDWVNVYGELGITGGGVTSNVVTPLFGYSAGRHQTKLLTDSCHAKVTVADPIVFGESRVVICADKQFNRYYGMAIQKWSGRSTISVIRGLSSIGVQYYDTTNVSVIAGYNYEVWYDELNTTVRVYRNGTEVASQQFAANDIPHGPNSRYTGVVMGANWLIDIGPNFADFEAWDDGAN